MELLHTGIGRKFFDGDIPRIADSLEKMTKILDEIRLELKQIRINGVKLRGGEQE